MPATSRLARATAWWWAVLGVALGPGVGRALAPSVGHLWAGVAVALVGCLAGVLWFLRYPRPLVDRLYLPLAVLGALLVLMAVIGGDGRIERPSAGGSVVVLGLLGGLVLAEQRSVARRPARQTPVREDVVR